MDHCVVALALRLLLMISLERSIRMFFVITEHVRTERGRTIAHIHIVHIHAVLSCCLPVRVWVSDDLQTDFDFSVITQLFSSLSLALFRFEGFQVMKIDSMNFTASFRIREIEILSIDRHFFVFTLWTRSLRGQCNAIWSFIDIWSMKKKEEKKARRKCQSISFSDSVSSNVVVCVFIFCFSVSLFPLRFANYSALLSVFGPNKSSLCTCWCRTPIYNAIQELKVLCEFTSKSGYD